MKKSYYNGKVYLKDNLFALGFIIEENKFTYIGNDLDILMNADELVDLEGKTVIPGLNDSHMHFLGLGYNKTIINLSNIKNVEEMIEVLSKSKKEFIVGRGWNQENFSDKHIPSKVDLDKVSTDTPIVLIRVCGHVAVANSKALELANITCDSPQIEGGTFDYETGLFTEDALGIIYKLFPPVNKEDLRVAFKSAQADLLQLGLTSIQSDDFSTLQVPYEMVAETLKEMYENDELQIRLSEQVNLPTKELLNDYIEKDYQSYQSEKLDFGILKLLADGSLGGRTAYLSEPYSDDLDNYGIPIFTQEQLDELVLIAHKNNIDVGIHAIGDATCKMIIESIDKAQSIHKRDHRHGIIHAQIINEDLIEEMKNKDIGAYIQPIFLNSDNNIVESRLGQRANHSYLFKTMYKSGLITAFGTDAPVEDVNPFKNIYCAITRKSVDGPNFEAYLKSQAFTIEETIDCYTNHSAKFMKKDNLGQIKENYLADFIVLDRDIFKIDANEILNTVVLETVVDGKTVYKK